MTTLLTFTAGLLVGLLVMYVLRRRITSGQADPDIASDTDRAAAPLPAAAPAPETPGDDSAAHTLTPPDDRTATPTVELMRLTQKLDAVGEASAHPRDLVEDDTFNAATRMLVSDAFPVGAVADFATGANWVLSAAACVALARRPDGQVVEPIILSRLSHLRPWALYYAFQFLDGLEPPTPAGAIVLRAQEWWRDHLLIPALVTDLCRSRSDRGDTPGFGTALTRATAEEMHEAEAMLERIDHDFARRLLAVLVAHRRAQPDRAYLQTLGRFADGDERPLLVEHAGIVEQLAHAEVTLRTARPRSLVVVGEPRSGKTSFISLLAARLEAAGWTMFESGGVDLQAGQKYIGELEERLRRFVTEVGVEKRILWHAPSLLQLATSGTHQGQTATILDQVLPSIASGRVVLVSEITPDGWTRLLQLRPSIRTAFELVRLNPLGEPAADALVSTVATRVTTQLGITIAPDVVQTTTYLARHHLGTAQAPGAALDLLKLSLQRAAAHEGQQARRDDVLATMAQLTGMPKQVLDDRERVDLAALRAFFSARVIGQDEAVGAVVDRIAMLKAGLTDATKPIGVLLFAGPTGTGKTELAKAIAEFLFGAADRLLRLDMSEFQTPAALRKIVGEPDARDDTGALTDRVRKQPFSVVLLDEFEKADAQIWDLFLQVFDDGRLSDANGHTVDFRHCLIILTSNVGSTLRGEDGPGFTPHAAAGLSTQQVMKAINKSFRPEFINRLDRIIVFRPLGRDQMRGIVAKELALVLQRRGLRNREWAVEWEPSALEFLLDKGFSPTMGARPLKRAIDQHLLAPLAATLVEHRFPEGDQFLFVRSDGRALQVEFVDPDAQADAPPGTLAPDGPALDLETALHGAGADAGPTLARMILQPAGAPAERMTLNTALRRLEERMDEDRWTELQGSLAARMQDPDFWHAQDRQAVLSRFEVMDRVAAATATARSLAGRLDRSETVSGRYSKELVSRLASLLHVLTHGIQDVEDDSPVDVVLAVDPVSDRSTDAPASARWCGQLREMYRAWAGRRGMQWSECTGATPADVLFVISGFGAARLLAGEVGLHVLDHEQGGQTVRTIARVTLAPGPMALPESAARRYAMLATAIQAAPSTSVVVRRYRLGSSPTVRDVRGGWRTGRVELVLGGQFDLIGDAWPVAAE